MILLSHEVKLKLQALALANANHDLAMKSNSSGMKAAQRRYQTDFDLHVAIRELIACLPPELMAGLSDESNKG